MTAKVTMFRLIIFACHVSIVSSPQACTPKDKDTIVCKDKISATVQPGVTRVYIEFISNYTSFEDELFSHQSWRNVTFVDITANRTEKLNPYDIDFGRIKYRHFFPNLEELGIHGDEVNNFSLDTFKNIYHLSVLNLSNCRYIRFKSLFDSLLSADITIDKLYLNDISPSMCPINRLSLELLYMKQVKKLSLRNTDVRVGLFGDLYITIPEYLEEVDFSRVKIKQHEQPLDIIMMYMHRHFMEFTTSIHLTTLNISSVSLQHFFQAIDFIFFDINTDCNEVPYTFLFTLSRLENLYANDIFKVPIVDNKNFNFSNGPVYLNRWHFRRNRIEHFNLTFPLNNTLKEIDISDNELKYISPQALQTATRLEILNLQRNQLFNMQTSPQFKDLLVSFKALKYFNLAENNISYLPQDMFRNNIHLQYIDLSDNILNTFTVTIKQLKRLKLLNLGGNRIKFLKDSELAKVKLFMKRLPVEEHNHTAGVELAGNPFECKCESVQFMQWVISVVQKQSIKKHHCKLGNEEKEINENSLKDAKFLCYRTAVIVGTITVVLVVCIGIFFLTAFILRRKKLQKQRIAERAFLNDFLNGALEEKYLCQISYANEDEMCVLNSIHANLGIALTKHWGIGRDFICIGDKQFCLGRPIVNEILRCISESCVLIFVISKSFCNSRWCEMELREAYEMEKPIILIFKEEVNEELMSTLLLTLFNRLTRAKLVNIDGMYSLVPDWESLGESIIKLASEKYKAVKPTIGISFQRYYTFPHEAIEYT